MSVPGNAQRSDSAADVDSAAAAPSSASLGRDTDADVPHRASANAPFEAAASTTARQTRWWARRWALPLLLAVLGVLTFLPALRSSFLLDDYLHASMAEGSYPVSRSPFDLYDFVNDGDRAVLLDRGILPWWSHPALKIRFFRPLSSLLLWTNHHLFPHRPLLLHLHSLAWWGLAVVVAHRLFGRLFRRRVRWLATFIFALAPCHAAPLAWLANYEALVTLTLGGLALLVHLRWRQSGEPRWAWASGGAFAITMLSGEYALALGGYVLAFEAFAASRLSTERRSPARAGSLIHHAVGVLPFALPAAAYLAVRAALGCGSVGSGFYVDPLSAPWQFLKNAPWRLLTLFANGMLSLDADTLGARPSHLLVLALGALIALCSWVPMRRTLASLSPQERTAAWVLLAGALGGTLPMLAVNPSPRVIGISMLGAAPVIALVLDYAWSRPRSEPRRGVAEWVQTYALALGFLHLVHGPVTSFLYARSMRLDTLEFEAKMAWLRARVGDVGTARVGIVRGLGGMFFAPFAIEPHGRAPHRWRMLAQSGHVLVLRLGARTLELRAPRDQSLIASGPWNLFRADEAPISIGESFAVEGMRVTVLDTGPAGPTRAQIVFDDEVERMATVWLSERVFGFFDARIPKVGFGEPFDL